MDFKLTKEKMLEKRVNTTIRSGSYFDNFKSQKYGEVVKKGNGTILDTNIVISEGPWANSPAYNKLWNEIEDLRNKVKNQLDNRRTNISVFPDDYYDLVDLLRIDITRRRAEEMDYTAEFTQEIVNPGFSKSITLDEFLPYAGAFEEITGANNTVPMIEAKTGVTGSVTQILYGLGFARTLEDELYNTDIYSLEKVQTAVVRAHTAKRNDLLLGALIAITTAAGWDSSQQQAADTTSGATKEELLYNTINGAIETITKLLDPQTKQEIDVPRLVIACRPGDVRRINRAINGQLNVGGKGKPSNFAALNEVSELWPYRGDTLYVGKKKVTFSGIAENKAYIFVPGSAGAPAWTLTKRGLTQEVGRGSVLELSREERAWYFSQTKYIEEFLGSSSTTLGLATGYGWVVEITLPAA